MKMVLASLAIALAFVASATGQSLTAPYAGSYSLLDLNTPAGIPVGLGGLLVSSSNPNTLLISGNWDNGAAAIYSIGVNRNSGGHITGFSGSATFFANAPNIDGGLTYAPNGTLLYYGYPTDAIGEIKPGSTSPDKTVTLSGNIGGGALGFEPSGFSDAGTLKIMNYYSGQVFNGSLTADGSGTYGITESLASGVALNSPAGFVYVNPGAPDFSGPSMLVTDYKGGIEAYSVNSLGDPTGAATEFITGLASPRGGAIDPVTGDFIFGSFNGNVNHVYVVSGFGSAVPEPSTLVLTSLGLAGLAITSHRRRKLSRSNEIQGDENRA